MKYDPEKTQERLRNIPLKDRVFIYNAAIIIEFLNQTFMPTYYFLNEKGIRDLGDGKDLTKFHLKDPNDFYESKMTLGDIYDLYKLFREQQSFTTPLESRYKMSVILKKLNFNKNGWKLTPRRIGNSQLIYFCPVKLRIRVDEEIRKKFPPARMDLEESQVEVKKEDHESEVGPENDEIHVSEQMMTGPSPDRLGEEF